MARDLSADLTTDLNDGLNPSSPAGVSRRGFLQRVSGMTGLLMLPAGARAQAAPLPPRTSVVTVEADPERVLNNFDPDLALGTSMDILPQGVVDTVYTPANIQEYLSAGWGPISYRQNTELQMAAWHWNPDGVWSDAAHRRGYFTGNATPTGFIRHSYGYPLPRRGNTRNGGNERGYSRLTDGDPATFWKSHPCLTRHFTGEEDALHPQWVVIDLGDIEQVDALRIDWHAPYARSYVVQYWPGADAMNKPADGHWIDFPQGTVENGQGGRVTLRLAEKPVTARYLRIFMTASSHTGAPDATSDVRDHVGYAITEVYAGAMNSEGEFVDFVHHLPGQNQTATYCSSIDPWHAAEDLLEAWGDQTGFDLFFTSGITNHLPAMIPVSVLYGMPEDSAAQIAYLKARGYPIAYVEMGEECDGQYMQPEDYATLYLQWAEAIHRVAPELKLGGPSFEGVNEDIKAWPDAQGRTSWFGRFLDYLKQRKRMHDFAFLSFEHYPFPPCDTTWPDLYREPQRVAHILQVWRQDGLPRDIPMFITESNLSWELTPWMVDIFSALWLADNVGAFFAAGGNALYHSPIQQEPLRPGCHGWGTYGNFVAGKDLQIQQHTAQYWAARLINLEWAQHHAGVHFQFPVLTEVTDDAGFLLITAYALHRPDGQWALLLVNKDQENAHGIRVTFEQAAGHAAAFAGPVTMTTFGSEQYQWRPEAAKSHADPDLPPVVAQIHADAGTVFRLPKASVTVLRGAIATA